MASRKREEKKNKFTRNDKKRKATEKRSEIKKFPLMTNKRGTIFDAKQATG